VVSLLFLLSLPKRKASLSLLLPTLLASSSSSGSCATFLRLQWPWMMGKEREREFASWWFFLLHPLPDQPVYVSRHFKIAFVRSFKGQGFLNSYLFGAFQLKFEYSNASIQPMAFYYI